MNLTFAPKEILQIDDAKIIYRNFSGVGTKYNREGDRNFAVVIPEQDMADALINAGWNVKIKPPKDDGDIPFMYLPVKIKFNDRGPSVYLSSGRARTKLSEENVDCLDNIDISSVDLDIRPYDWGPIGPEEKYGRTAYLLSIHVTQDIDRFAARFAEVEEE